MNIINIQWELFPRNEAKISVFDSVLIWVMAIWEADPFTSRPAWLLSSTLCETDMTVQSLDMDIGSDKETLVEE